MTDPCSCKIMGILNATPDSFSGDGSMSVDVIVEKGLRMIQDGADILDIGGESSAPYVEPVSAAENSRRVVPVIRKLRKLTNIPISVDSFHPETVQAAVDAGANIINDITGFENPGMVDIAVKSQVKIIIMHMKGTPKNMQDNPTYSDVIGNVRQYLTTQYQSVIAAGVSPKNVILDPGIGFGKTLEHNLELIRNLEQFRVSNCPILLGASRKSMIGTILGTDVKNRLEGSLAAAAGGILYGANILRVHDVLATKRFLTVFEMIKEAPVR